MSSWLTRRGLSRGLKVGLAGVASGLAPLLAEGQGGAVGSGPALGAPGDIAVLHFANSNLGPFSTGGSAGPLRVVDGTLDVVDHQNQRMLRASARSTLLLSLPTVLPRDFTLELDLVPKECCQPEDVAIEGTTTINQGPASANILWSRDAIRVIGGGPGFDQPVPGALAAALPGALTSIMFTFKGDELTVYTNGQLLYTLPNRLFVRGRTVRIFLGGQNATDQAVYLARFRVAAGALAPSAVASAPPPPPSGGASSATSSQGLAGGSSSAMQPFAGNVNVTLGPNGPIVRWSPVVTRATYQVVRWKADDPMCCVNASPMSPMLAASPWQDAPLTVPGPYAYQVTAFTNGGPFVAQGQFVYQGTGGGTIVAPAGSGSTGTVAAQPTVTAPIAAGAGTVPSGMTVAVTMGSSGPVVSWTLVSRATGYQVTRARIDDANCCNASSGPTPLTGTTWQDQAPPVTGTYVYTVTALSTVGPIQGAAQLAYTAPATVVPVGPISGTATASPMPASGTMSTTQPSGGPGMPSTTCAATASSTTSTTNTMTSTSTATAGSAPACSARFRVTVTGFHVFRTTNEPAVSPDGSGDEVYAAVATLLWNRNALTIGARTLLKTKEHGHVGTAGLFPSRVQAGTMTPTGGIWTGNGTEQVPSQYSPNGSSFPTPTVDQFPLLVWEGTLTDGADALLVVPTLWERDLDPTIYTVWERYWTTSPLASLFSNPTVNQLILSTTLGQILNPVTTLGTPLDVPLADMQASVRDRPVGTTPTPMPLPVVGRYEDRFIILTREKLANLSVGGGTIMPVQYAEPTTIFSNGHYTLYLRIERLQ